MEAGQIAAQGDVDDGTAHIDAIRKKLQDLNKREQPGPLVTNRWPLTPLSVEGTTVPIPDNIPLNPEAQSLPLTPTTSRTKAKTTGEEPAWSQVSTRSKTQEGGNQQFHFDMPATLHSNLMAYEKILLENKGLTLVRVALVGAAIESFRSGGVDLAKWMFEDKDFNTETQPFSSRITKDQMLKIKKTKLAMRANGQPSITIKEIMCAALNKFLKEAGAEIHN